MEKESKVKDQFSFNMRFDGIKVIKYSQYDLENEFDINASSLVEFQSKFQFRALEKEGKILSLITVEIVINETKEKFAEIVVENSFVVKPFHGLLKSKESMEIPEGLIVNIASISASTLRGILFEKLKGTIIQNEIYPLLDMSFLLNKNIER